MDTIFTILISIFPTMVSYIGTFFIGLIIGWFANTIISNKQYKTFRTYSKSKNRELEKLEKT